MQQGKGPYGPSSGGYPAQQQQQPYYPMHHQQQQQYPPQQYPPQGLPPPPYYAYQQSPHMMQHQQGPYQPQPQYSSYPYPSGTSQPPQYTMPATGTTVVVQGAFDAGARFDGVSRPNIPPPPPGCAPNMAQMATMQGHTVVGTQKRDNFFWGETGGGWTW